ncbi:drebrin-like isoform X2 [Pleurodeles waltl]|uniref:drebrin-like isoform X2 n=1 Tax=Pleurodeles waltl TaxID=8319 RepID=UPI00370996C6
MGSVNLDTYSLSLLAAKEDILSGRCSTNWAVFTYEKRNNLKLLDSGAGGLEELAPKFTDTRLLYALCQVKDPGTGQPRVVLINWVGEKVDELYRQTCSTHLPAIRAFFKEASVIISARRTEEVTSSAIHHALSSLTSSTSTSRKTRLVDSEELVGTNYRKTNPALEMRRSKRDSFWAQAEREEEERKEEERRRLQEERKRWDRERMEQEKREAEERERKIREKEQMIEEQRKEQARLQAEERKREKTKWEQQQREHEEEMRDRFRRSESIEKAAEAAVLVSQRSLNPREFFRQRENSLSSSTSLSPTSPPPGGTRRPALRYQRSLTESSFMVRKPESPISPSPSPSYARRHEFFSSTSPRTPPETCSPSMIFSKAGAPTRGGRFPIVSPPRAGTQPPKPFFRADSLPAASLTQTLPPRPSSPPNISRVSPTSLPTSQPLPPLSADRSETQNHISSGRINSLSPTSSAREEPKPPTCPPIAESTPPASLLKDESQSLRSLPDHESPALGSPYTHDFVSVTNTVKVDSKQPSIPPNIVTPSPIIPDPIDSADAFTADRAERSPFAISVKYESLLDDPTPRVDAAVPASPPGVVPLAPTATPDKEPVPSLTLSRPEFECQAIITRCEPVPDPAPCNEPSLPASQARAVAPPAVIPPEEELIPLVTSTTVEFQSSDVTSGCEPTCDPVSSYTEPHVPDSPPRAVSPPHLIAPLVDAEPSLASFRGESSPMTDISKYELLFNDVTLPASPPRAVSPSSVISPAEESVLSEPTKTGEFQSSAILTGCELIPEHVAPCARPPLSASLPRAVSPPAVIPLTDQSLQSFTPFSEETLPVIITAGYESLLDDVTSSASPPREESPPSAVPSLMELVHSLTSGTREFQSPTFSAGCDVNSHDTTQEVKPTLSPSPPRSASPPLAVPPAVESVPGASLEATGSPFCAISPKDEVIPNDDTPSCEPELPGSPPIPPSSVVATTWSEAQGSLLSTTNQDLVQLEPVVIDYQEIPSEASHRRLESLAHGLPTRTSDGVETSQFHVSFTDDVHHREYVVSQNTSSTVDPDSISTTFHTLADYTPLETELEISYPVQSADITMASVNSPGKGPETGGDAPVAGQDPSAAHADVPYTLGEIQVNGARLNGIGGQEDEETQPQEMTREQAEQDQKMNPGSYRMVGPWFQSW